MGAARRPRLGEKRPPRRARRQAATNAVPRPRPRAVRARGGHDQHQHQHRAHARRPRAGTGAHGHEAASRRSIDRGHRDERSTSRLPFSCRLMMMNRPTWHVRRCCVYIGDRGREGEACAWKCAAIFPEVRAKSARFLPRGGRVELMVVIQGRSAVA